MLDKVVKYIKANGCKVRLYKKYYVAGGTAAGTFSGWETNKPLISIALKGASEKDLSSVALHEFGHYLQWKDGTLAELDKHGDGWSIFSAWVEGQEFSPDVLKYAVKSTVLGEYDAYCRAWDAAQKIDVNIGSEKHHFDTAHSYISSIKRDFELRTHHVDFPQLKLVKWKLPLEEVALPLTEKERRRVDVARSRFRIFPA